uniref:Transmembrane protein 129 n=1 Tax=Schistocephalus solidus TaxID=70667 RepID=A0A0X3NI97_SCHSO
MLSGTDVVLTMSYALFAFGLIVPPDVLLASGLTLENLFHRWLGSEEISFVTYHLRRTIMVRLVAGFLPLGYFLFMMFFASTSLATYLLGGIGLSLSLALVIFTHVCTVWYARGTWEGHPTVRNLCEIVKRVQETPPTEGDPPELELLRSLSSWQSVASHIDAECRRLEKFTAYSGRGLISSWPGRRFLVTNSWILFSHASTFKPIFQFMGRLCAMVVDSQTLLDTQTTTMSGHPAGENLGTQTMATVRIVDSENGLCQLSVVIPVGDLEELRTYLQFPLIVAQGVVLEPTIVQQFLTAFLRLVAENPTVRPPADMELESCIGCMSQTVNACLRRNCVSAPEAHCGVCHCRPMWCASCLGRWFASRVTEAHKPTSEWLSCRVPCPTCRAAFCIRDVALLET